MGYCVKGFAKIEKLNMNFSSIIQILCKVFGSGQELSFTPIVLLKSVLIGIQDVIVFQLLHEVLIDKVLHYFIIEATVSDTGQYLLGSCLVPFLIIGTMLASH